MPEEGSAATLGGGEVSVAPADDEPTVALWDLLARPVDPWVAAESLLGMSPGAAHVLAAILLLSSPETEALLAGMTQLSRSLAMSTTTRPARSHGELRGPILWSETAAARSATAGDTACFVYSVTARAYDTSENRVLVAALRALADAGRLVTTPAVRERDGALARLLSSRSVQAIRWLEHRALVGVNAHRLTPRDRQRTRGATRRRQYRLALELLDRHGEPLTAEDLALVADARTKAQHRAVVALVAGLRLRQVDVPPITLHQGAASAGPVLFIHERSRRGRTEGGGIRLGDRYIDVPVMVDGRMRYVGATATPDDRPHLFLGSVADVPAVLTSAGF